MHPQLPVEQQLLNPKLVVVVWPDNSEKRPFLHLLFFSNIPNAELKLKAPPASMCMRS